MESKTSNSDFSNNCRVCLKVDLEMTAITILEENVELKKLLDYLHISILEDTRYPDKICWICTTHLYETIQFRENCEKSYQYVQKVLLLRSKDTPELDFDEQQIDEVRRQTRSTTNNSRNVLETIINELNCESTIKEEQIKDEGLIINEDNDFFNDFESNASSEDIKPEEPQKKRNYKRHDSSSDRPYECSFCKKKFSWRKVLVNHLRIHTGEKPFNCKLCSKQFGASSALAYHRKRVHEKHEKPSEQERERFFCVDCKKYFTLQNSLNIHRKKYHAEITPPKTVCKVCGHAVNNIYSHMKNKHSEPEFKCKYCDKAFPYKSGLLKHIDHIHEKSDSSFKSLCTECGKAFRTNGELKLHTKVKHSEERNYQCKYCERRFKTSSHCLQHEKSAHLDERSYKCSYCPKAFTTKRILVSHVRTHTGEKPYVCSICSRAFTQNGALTTHTRLVHGSTIGR